MISRNTEIPRNTEPGLLDPSVGTAEVTDDAFLGGRLMLRQPSKGYRAGVDAVLLAAAATLEDIASGPVLDAGAGVGAVGLCLATRLPQARVTLLERQSALVALARGNTDRNGLSDRVTLVEADILKPTPALDMAGIANESFALALANPPYHDSASGTVAQNEARAQSHQMPDADLDAWARFLARMVRPAGRVIVIHKAESLARLLAALDGRFGAVAVRPVHARASEPAIRVLVSAVKASRAPVSLLPPVVLHGDGQAFRPEIDAVLRCGAPLP